MGILTDRDIERRCRYRLARHGLRMKKLEGNDGRPVYYLYEIGGDDSKPDEDDHYRWFSQDKLIDYCEELAEKEAEDRYNRNH